MAKDLKNILLSTIEENKIKEKTPDKLPLNPTAEGWSGQEVRRFLAKSLIDSEGSFLSEFKKKMIEIKAQFEDIFGQGDGDIQGQVDSIIQNIISIESTASLLATTVFNNYNTLNNLKVNKTLTILGIDLQDDIPLSEFKTALGDATIFVNGLMSALDKQNLAQTMIDIQSLFSDKADKTALAVTNQNVVDLQNDKVNKTTKIIGIDLEDNILLTEFKIALGNATNSLAGLMSATDKTRLDALHSLLEEDEANTVVDSINEILAIFNQYPEGADLVSVLSTKADKVDVYKKAETYNQAEISALFEGLNSSLGLRTSLITASDLENEGIVLTNDLINGVSFVVFTAINTITGELDSDTVPASTIIPGKKFIFFDNENIVFNIGETNSTFSTTETVKLRINVMHSSSEATQASEITYEGNETNYLQDETNVDEAIKELDTQVKATNDSIPDISLNDNTATEGKYISQLEVDSVDLHKINITKADLPTIPSDVSDLTDTTELLGEANVQSDWNQTVDTEDDFIKNKPIIPDISTKVDKIEPSAVGNIPKLNASGNLEDSGFKLEKSVPSNAVFTDTPYTLPQASTNTRGGIRADTKQATDTVEVKIDVASEKLYAPTYPTVPTKTSDLTDDIGFATETYVNNKVSSVYKIKGSVDDYSSLPTENLTVGDVYNLLDTGDNYVWDGTNWDKLSGTVDLSGYVEKDGTKVLSDNNFTTTLKDKLDGAEITSNKVSSWSPEVNNKKYPSEKLVKDSLDELDNKIEGVSDLSPYHYEGTFIGDDLLQNDFDNLIVDFEDLKDGGFNETKLQGSYFVCSADSAFWFNTIYHWSASAGGGTSTITYTWTAPYDLSGLTDPINMKPGDIISILDFSYDAGSNKISTLIKVEKSLDTKADKVIPASTGNIPKLNASGNLEDSGFKLEKSVPSNAVFTDTIPTVPTISTDITTDATSDAKTASPKAVKTYVDNTISTDLENKADKRPAQKTITTATTLALTDEGKVILANGALKVTIPLNSSVSFPIDTEIAIVRYGTGEVTIGTASGATLNGEASTTTFTLGDQYSSVALKKISTNAWLIIGNFT